MSSRFLILAFLCLCLPAFLHAECSIDDIEGVEDYEYLHLLKQLIDKRKSEGVAVNEAETVLNKALGLVNIPTADGRYTTGYLRDPDAVLKARDMVATAIENLRGQK